jgi:hypothetical protein
MNYESSKTWAFICSLPNENDIRVIVEECASNPDIELDLLSNFFYKPIDEIIEILKNVSKRLNEWHYVLDPLEQPIYKNKCFKSLIELDAQIKYAITTSTYLTSAVGAVDQG